MELSNYDELVSYIFSNSSSRQVSSHWDHLKAIEKNAFTDLSKTNDFLSRAICIGMHDASEGVSNRWQLKRERPLDKVYLSKENSDKDSNQARIILSLINRYYGDESASWLNFLGSSVGGPLKPVKLKLPNKIIETSFHEISLLYFAFRIKCLQEFLLIKPKFYSVLEIGSGYCGLLEKLLLLNIPIENYYICDLPENLSIATLYVNRLCESGFQVHLRTIDDQKKIGLPNVVIVPIDKIEDIAKIDLAVNMRSFGEMPLNAIKRYFAVIQEKLKFGGLFFQVNRLSKESKTETINLKNYPFDNSWRLISFMCFPAIYDCYELSCIRERSKTDVLRQFLNTIPPYQTTLPK